jgi:capsular polysaccharide biosynthesis protein
MNSLDHFGVRNGLDQSSLKHCYLDWCEKVIQESSARSIAIISATPKAAFGCARTFGGRFPDTSVLVLSCEEISGGFTDAVPENTCIEHFSSIASAFRILSGWGPADILLEDSNNIRSLKRTLFTELFGSLSSQGIYIAEDLHAASVPKLLDDTGEDVWPLIARLMHARANPPIFKRLPQNEKKLALAICCVQNAGKILAVQKDCPTSPKLGYDDVDDVLRRRRVAKQPDVIMTFPAQDVRGAALATYFGSGKANLAESRRTPEIKVREYYYPTVNRGQVLSTDGVILPDSFRLSRLSRIKSTKVKDFSRLYAHSPAKEGARLPGRYYYLDIEFRQHFGHFMTEIIPRLYAWHELKRQDPTLKVLIAEAKPNVPMLEYQTAILRGFGIDDIDVVTFRDTVVPDSLVCAPPLMVNGQYAHPHLKETFQRLGRGLALGTSTRGRKIYVLRERGLWRECVNEPALVDFFRNQGFDVVRPDHLTFNEQAKVFRECDVIAGQIGSSLYNVMMCEKPVRLFTFVNESYKSTNEFNIASVLGHEMNHFVFRDIVDGRGKDCKGRPLAPTNYDYAFDFTNAYAALVAAKP